MKTLLTFVLPFIMIFDTLLIKAQDTDPIKKANAANEKKADDKIVDEDVAEFLVKSADSRMMDMKEGQMAVKKGTTKSIRDYGQLMVKDQTMLLGKIKQLAASRHITLPAEISDKKQDGREELEAQSGKDFDEKFTKMMKIDHERDVKLFKKATECKDNGVSQFAKEYLPMIQMHLDKVNEIKQESKSSL